MTAQLLALLTMDQPLDRIDYIVKLAEISALMDLQAKIKALRATRMDERTKGHIKP
ncbi:MAG: hypothetical protein GY757_53675 [bacterium]|nr:hypothetical protein [bacterium]